MVSLFGINTGEYLWLPGKWYGTLALCGMYQVLCLFHPYFLLFILVLRIIFFSFFEEVVLCKGKGVEIKCFSLVTGIS